ncbi:hypothetical protein CEXT_534821 [Caerostris extrusa]|uniref:Uncharacterized protein n=1 Tax=Caerostris extrusa TaxID=172846 RepID=A0AAV4NFS0_CAEEX|nr:hypothetical protein CEXT_534821 [Caerostris extrusa]
MCNCNIKHINNFIEVAISKPSRLDTAWIKFIIPCKPQKSQYNLEVTSVWHISKTKCLYSSSKIKNPLSTFKSSQSKSVLPRQPSNFQWQARQISMVPRTEGMDNL